jgi:hypothetical protein
MVESSNASPGLSAALTMKLRSSLIDESGGRGSKIMKSSLRRNHIPYSIQIHELACRRSSSQSRFQEPASPSEEYWLMDRPPILAETQEVSAAKSALRPLWPAPDVEKLPPRRWRLRLYGCDPIGVYTIPSMFRAASRAGPKHDMLQPRNVGANGCSKACRYRDGGDRAGDHNFPVNHPKSPNLRDSPRPQYTAQGAAHAAKFRVPS